MLGVTCCCSLTQVLVDHLFQPLALMKYACHLKQLDSDLSLSLYEHARGKSQIISTDIHAVQFHQGGAIESVRQREQKPE